MNQLELYKKIDEFFKQDIKTATKEDAEALINVNFDAKDYFFTNAAPIEWISWFIENKFCDILNTTDNSINLYPELQYLERVVNLGGDETKVLEVINFVNCVKNYNPQVINRFLWIAGRLTTKNLIKLIPKIKKENWVELMKGSNADSFNYQPIVKKLLESKEYDSLIILAETILTINKNKKSNDYSEKTFILKDIDYTDIFEALSKLEGEYAEKGIKLIVEKLNELSTKAQKDKNSPFEYESTFHLYDIDLFNISIIESYYHSYNGEIKLLIAVLIKLIERSNVRQIFDKHLSNLLETEFTWKIKLFAMSRCPEIFKEELTKELNRLFESDKYSVFISGTEYYKTLKLAFPHWLEKEKREYVKKVLNYFSQKALDFPDQKWHKRNGWEILSTIELIEDEKNNCKKSFDKLPDPNFEAEPSIGEIRGGMVKDISPINISAIKNIKDLIEKLKNELSPKILKEKYKGDDFLNPRNAQGVGDELREDMKKRMSDYLIHASDFISENLDIHYTYSFLRAIEEYLRDKNKLEKSDWKNLFTLFAKIQEANKSEYKKERQDNDEDRWLARFTWLEKIMAYILKYFLTDEYRDFFPENRNFILGLIKYLLNSEDPITENEDNKYGDLFHIAINSTHGSAFQAFVNFVYLDDRKILKEDVIELYKDTIDRASLSVRFVIGHYLASFYYRNPTIVKDLFPKIFPKGEDRHENFVAAWEGYLVQTLYRELFEDLEEYYTYALKIDSSSFPKRERSHNIDEAIGTHLALAFAHFDKVDLQHPLIKKLWENNDIVKQKAFISFLGREIEGKKTFKDNIQKIEKFKHFWKFIIEQKNANQALYSSFGTWISHEENIFDYNWLAEIFAKTITKSNGEIEWDHGFLTKLNELAKANPEKTIIILEKYLLGGILGKNNYKNYFYLDKEKINVFEELYQHSPVETTSLVNKLLEKGGSIFRPLREVVEK